MGAIKTICAAVYKPVLANQSYKKAWFLLPKWFIREDQRLVAEVYICVIVLMAKAKECLWRLFDSYLARLYLIRFFLPPTLPKRGHSQ